MKKITVIGNIGKDATISEFNGKKVINFNIAENEYYIDNNGNKVEKTTWFTCSMWKSDEQKTKIADFLKAGTKVYIEGTPEPKFYKNDRDEVVPFIQINVKQVELLSQKVGKND